MQIQEMIDRLDRALEKSRKGEYLIALDEFRALEALSWHQQDIAALRFFQARCLTDLGRIPEAQATILTVDKNSLGLANQIDFEFERARIARACDDRSEALCIVENTLKTIDSIADKSDISTVTMNLQTIHGILLAELGRCKEAIPLLDAVPTEDLGWAEAKIRRGDCCIRTSRFQEAIDSYREVLTSDKDIGSVLRNEALGNIGVARYYLGQYRESIDHLMKIKDAYETYPSLKAEIYEFIALAHQHLGNIAEAEECRSIANRRQLLQ